MQLGRLPLCQLSYSRPRHAHFERDWSAKPRHFPFYPASTKPRERKSAAHELPCPDVGRSRVAVLGQCAGYSRGSSTRGTPRCRASRPSSPTGATGASRRSPTASGSTSTSRCRPRRLGSPQEARGRQRPPPRGRPGCANGAASCAHSPPSPLEPPAQCGDRAPDHRARNPARCPAIGTGSNTTKTPGRRPRRRPIGPGRCRPSCGWDS